MKIADNLLKSNTPYMLRNDGAILECGDAHPYIKYYFEYDDNKNINELLKHPESLDWYYENSLQPEVKSLIDDFRETKSKESFNKLNNLLNNEFCRVRTSNIKYKYGGDNGEIYFRVSSEGFNWFDLIWKAVLDNKDFIKYVTVVKDQQTFGKPYDYYKHKDKELKHIPTEEFLTLSGNPIIEVIVKKGSKWQVQSEKGRNLGTYDTKKEAEDRLKQVEYFKHLDESIRIELPQYLYHATYKPFLKSIKEKGLGNTSRKMWSDSKGKGVVYLSLDKDVAYSYAETAEWLDDIEDYDKYADNIIILKIDTNKLDKEKLFIDENVLDNDSTVEYHGIIPFEAINEIIQESLKPINEYLETKEFKLGTAGYIKEDGSLIIMDEYHGEDKNLIPYRYPEFSNTHAEEDTCVRIWRKPTDAQYEVLEKIIDKYLDIEEYCKLEICNDFYNVYSLREKACQDYQWDEKIGNWTGYKLVQMIKNYFNNKLDESLDKDIISKECKTLKQKWTYFIWRYLNDNSKKHSFDWGGNTAGDWNGNIWVRITHRPYSTPSPFMNEYFEFELNEEGDIGLRNFNDIASKVKRELGKEAALNFTKEYNHFQSLDQMLNNTYYNPLQDLIGNTNNLISYLKDEGLLNEKLNESLLLEKKRSELISKSKSGANYKSKDIANQNRWDRRRYSKLATSVSDYNKIDMNTFWKEDILKFGIKVQGETNNYVVQVTFEKILERLRNEIERNNNKLEFKNVLRALINTFNSEDVYVECSCEDFLYGGFNHYAYKQGYNADPQFGPAMDAPVIRNPMDNLGAGCKHINLVLSNLSWMMKIASVINNYIWYCKDNMELNYAKYIFPKLYGMDYDRAIQLTLFDTDELETDEEIINLSNALGRRRTQFKPKGVEGGNPRFERERKEKPLENPLKLQFDDEEEKEEIKIVEPEVGNEDEEVE